MDEKRKLYIQGVDGVEYELRIVGNEYGAWMEIKTKEEQKKEREDFEKRRLEQYIEFEKEDQKKMDQKKWYQKIFN